MVAEYWWLTLLLMMIFEGSTGVMLLRFSCVQGECSATSAAGHRLAQGWMYASSTKLANSSTSLGVASVETKIQRFYRS